MLIYKRTIKWLLQGWHLFLFYCDEIHVFEFRSCLDSFSHHELTRSVFTSDISGWLYYGLNRFHFQEKRPFQRRQLMASRTFYILVCRVRIFASFASEIVLMRHKKGLRFLFSSLRTFSLCKIFFYWKLRRLELGSEK